MDKLEKLYGWSDRMNGGRNLLLALKDYGIELQVGVKGKENKIYSDAIVELLLSDIRNVQLFLEHTEIHFTGHVRDGKGKLVSVVAEYTPTPDTEVG